MLQTLAFIQSPENESVIIIIFGLMLQYNEIIYLIYTKKLQLFVYI